MSSNLNCLKKRFSLQLLVFFNVITRECFNLIHGLQPPSLHLQYGPVSFCGHMFSEVGFSTDDFNINNLYTYFNLKV